MKIEQIQDKSLERGVSLLRSLRGAIAQLPNQPMFKEIITNATLFANAYERALNKKREQYKRQESVCPVFDPQNDEGRKYLIYAQQQGIDPILFGMIIKNEWDHKAYEQGILFFMTQIDSNFSYGVGQIQGQVGMGVVRDHPELFGENIYPQLYTDHVLDQYKVEWELFVNESFNLSVAATYIADNQRDLRNTLEQGDIIVSDTPIEGKVTITNEQFEELLAVMYNEPPSVILNGLPTYPTPEEKYEAIVRTLSANQEYVDNTTTNRDYIESILGVSWVACYQ